MQDIIVKAVDGGAHVSFSLESGLNDAFKAAFPKARWAANAQAWAIPGVLAERRALCWAEDVRAAAIKREEDERAARAIADVPASPEGADYFAALKAAGRKMSTPNVRLRVEGSTIRVTCAYHETIPPALRRIGGRWDASRKVWLVPLAANEAARQSARQTELDRQRAAERQARDAARQAAEAGSAWWIVGTEPPLDRPFTHRGRTMVATRYGERRRIDTDGIAVNGGCTLEVETCVRVSLREATAADMAAAEAADRAAADARQREEQDRAAHEEQRRAEVERLADAIETETVLSVETVSGRRVVIYPLFPGEGRSIAQAHVERDGAVTYDGLVNKAYEIPATTPAAREAYGKLLATGATHTASITGGALALSAAGADRLNLIIDAIERVARRRQDIVDAARAAEIRATSEVRTVLVNSLTADMMIEEAWLPSSVQADRYAEHIRFAMPGRRGTVISRRCPSLRTVIERSPIWGAYPGHENDLRLISEADRALLLEENEKARRPSPPRPAGTPLVLQRVEDEDDAEMARSEAAIDRVGEG